MQEIMMDFILDHHVIRGNKEKSAIVCIFDLIKRRNKMAELVYERFCKNRRTCERIAKSAHNVDFACST